MNKTLGQALDEYLATQGNADNDVVGAYLYMEDYQTPKIIMTISHTDWDFGETLFKIADLNEQKTELQKTITSLKVNVKQLEKSKSDIEKAIKLLTK